MSSVVLDASALLAFLRREPGGERIAAVLDRAVISAVNVSEVVSKALDYGGTLVAVSTALSQLPIRTIPFDGEDAYRAASLRPMTRGKGLSLGDRSCLALGMRLGVPVLTAEVAWSEFQTIVAVEVIR
jgi:PIN domain nuclease of toxin-antitoxin system